MKIISLNVGLPREVVWKGKMVKTGIFKDPFDGRLRLNRLNFDGDRQADLSVHGGPDKAVYAYPSEHYAFWQQELSHQKLPWGAFGENLTTVGLLEDNVHIGDQFRVGSAELMVTQPRQPCFKLALRFERTDIIKQFHQSRRTGFYFSVIREGEVGAGDPLELLQRDPNSRSVSDVYSETMRGKNIP